MKVVATKRLVLDASVTLAWCFPEESTAFTDAVLDRLAGGGEALVPALWPFEVANGLLVAARRKRITEAGTTSILHRIGGLPIAVDPVRLDRTLETVLLAAQAHELTGYDAAYLELALREGLPMATLDEKLRSAARSAGIALLSL